MKRAMAFLAMAMVLVAVMVNPAISEDKQISGYVTTDMWLLGVTPYKPIALDHVVLAGNLSQVEIRNLASLGYYFAYTSDEYDVVIDGPLVIVVFYINGFSSNIICLGDAVK